MRRRNVLLLSVLLGIAGCGESGVGAACFAGDPSQPGNLKVLLGTGECSTSICVSYLGSPGYCSVQCETASACPSGFLCCPVVQTGPQPPCSTDRDCSSRQTCRQGQCRPKQFCVRATGSCQ